MVLYRLVPILIRGKYWHFFVTYCLWASISILINTFYRHYIVDLARHGAPTDMFLVNKTLSWSIFITDIFSLASFVVLNTNAMFAVFIRMVKYWHIEQQQKLQAERQRAEAEREKVQAELELLKAQLHPHFLFNTLNNLYAFVYEKSEKAPKMLLQLSRLLSYVLYECKANEVLLSNEINAIQNYISLEKERYGDRLDISTDFAGKIANKMVAPMLFQPFIENAFKHGTSEQLGNVWMSISLSVKEGELYFKTINSCGDNDETDEATRKTGVGIENVKKRLELLYPGKYNLQTGREDGVYVVTLLLQLLQTQPQTTLI
jgi:two-component system sensor histidine kinase AlgZ